MHMSKEDPYYFDTSQINMKNINLLQTFIFFFQTKEHAVNKVGCYLYFILS